jgi:preprotein translocase subunit SecF
VRAGNLSEEARAAFPEAVTINGEYEAVVERFNEVGPTIGVELRNKAIVALALVMTAIVLYIAFAFRKVSRPVSSWVYGLIAVITLMFDVLIPLGAYALFGQLWGAAVDTLFVTALLTILGYSVHDTIVVFDRVRENLRLNQERNRHEDFETIAGRSINQTFVRSMNTSVTTLASLLMLYLIGPASTQNFALVLIIGIVAGTFSSIALATPLLVAAEKRLIRRKK